MPKTTKDLLEVVEPVTESSTLATIAVLHLGHPSSPKYGTIELMTPEQHRKFVWLNTWPRPAAV